MAGWAAWRSPRPTSCICAAAVDLAREALDDGDEPFGSVLVDARRAGPVRGPQPRQGRRRDPAPRVRDRPLVREPPDSRGAARVHRLHLRRALPDVRRGACLGRPGPDRLRDVVRADWRVARGVGSPAPPGRRPPRSPTVAPGVPVDGPVPELADEVHDLQRRRFGRPDASGTRLGRRARRQVLFPSSDRARARPDNRRQPGSGATRSCVRPARAQAGSATPASAASSPGPCRSSLVAPTPLILAERLAATSGRCVTISRSVASWNTT